MSPADGSEAHGSRLRAVSLVQIFRHIHALIPDIFTCDGGNGCNWPEDIVGVPPRLDFTGIGAASSVRQLTQQYSRNAEQRIHGALNERAHHRCSAPHRDTEHCRLATAKIETPRNIVICCGMRAGSKT